MSISRGDPLVKFFKIPLYFASRGGGGVSQKAKMIYSYFLDAPRLKVFLLGMKMINPWKLPGSHKGIYFCADNAQRFLLIRKTSECSRVFSVAINAMGKLSTFTYGFYPSREREKMCTTFMTTSKKYLWILPISTNNIHRTYV